MNTFDAVVVGTGPAGLAAAYLLGQAGLRTVLIGRSNPDASDPRTVALMIPSLRLLAELGLWPESLEGLAAPLRRLRLVDDTGSPFAAPDIVFNAEEMGERAFGWNIPLARLTASLLERARAFGIAMRQGPAERLAVDATTATVTLADGTTTAAPVVLAADGRSSNIRRGAGISATEWSYDQVALALSFGHSGPHRDTSTEYHKEAGPFTTVPLPGLRSSLVWMERPARAAALLKLDDAALAAEIQIGSHGDLGRIGDIGPRGSFAMRGLRAATLARNRVMLLGEAGHVVPPVGAQGLNMSLRDAAIAAEFIAEAKARGSDPGDSQVLARYDEHRRADIWPRQSTIDVMNRSLLSHILPLEAGRAAGLAALKNFGPLRRFVMERGIGLGGDLPAAMRR